MGSFSVAGLEDHKAPQEDLFSVGNCQPNIELLGFVAKFLGNATVNRFYLTKHDNIIVKSAQWFLPFFSSWCYAFICIWSHFTKMQAKPSNNVEESVEEKTTNGGAQEEPQALPPNVTNGHQLEK